MRITVVGNQLQSQLGPQPVVPLFAESETVFFPRVVEAELTFELDASGNGDGAHAAPERPGEARAAHRGAHRGRRCRSTCSSVTPARIGCNRGFDLAITLENGQLMSQATGQGKAPLFAEAENKFFLKVANAQIEFVSAGGRVTELVLYQGGRETRAPRQ